MDREEIQRGARHAHPLRRTVASLAKPAPDSVKVPGWEPASTPRVRELGAMLESVGTGFLTVKATPLDVLPDCCTVTV